MEKASRAMYSIANFFTWILAILAIVGIVFSALSLAKVMPNEQLNLGTLIACAFILIVSLITIAISSRRIRSEREFIHTRT